jgi:hypothetical protein
MGHGVNSRGMGHGVVSGGKGLGASGGMRHGVAFRRNGTWHCFRRNET